MKKMEKKLLKEMIAQDSYNELVVRSIGQEVFEALETNHVILDEEALDALILPALLRYSIESTVPN